MPILNALTLALRATCHYIQVNSGDSCYSLAQSCKITQDKLIQYNQNPTSKALDFCKNLKPKDYVCCSAGTLPDFSPQPKNGHCAAYTVKKGETCFSIANDHQIKDYKKIETFNKQTWGWGGCDKIQVGQNICLSTGTPPFPAPVKDTVCGPQVPGTKEPKDSKPIDWAKLNPCPLKACCDVWGQCGITADFCTSTPSKTGAPGTAKPGTNGCISNCGNKIVNNGNKPATVRRVGYFEAWNKNRPCDRMDLSEIDKNYYTHVHWGFGNLTSDWKPDVSGSQKEFDDLVSLQGVKRILSFGGWAFATEPATYTVFRTGVLAQNRQKFASNVAKFIQYYDLDGVDFDWEYPGAQDIPGIPPDSKDSGKNYLEFLKLVRKELDPRKTISIAAPASYWYLKGFPIADISKTVDYIIFMTYDLHGQWDYGNKWASPDCPSGNCLRSHVNETETHDALAMVTKAGVPAAKIVVGMALYGRSFKMSQAGCHGPNCHYTGPASGAKPGKCTNTAGYISNTEIDEIISDAKKKNKKISQYYDQGDVLVYDDTEWVSYLTISSYHKRKGTSDGLNFGGTSDWAIDLNGTHTGYLPYNNIDLDDFSSYTPCDMSREVKDWDELKGISKTTSSQCLGVYALGLLIKLFDDAMRQYDDVNNGYDALFPDYIKYIKRIVPDVILHTLMLNDTAPQFRPDDLVHSGPPVGYGMNTFNCDTCSNYPCKGSTPHEKYPCKDWNEHGSTFNPTTLKLTDRKKFNTNLQNVGLEPDWVDFGSATYEIDPVNNPKGNFPIKYNFQGDFPVLNESLYLPNPKDIVVHGLGNLKGLRKDMESTWYQLKLRQWGGDAVDPAAAYALPVFMLMQAIDSMAEAKKLAEKELKIEAEERKARINFILQIVSAVLLFVPAVGEAAGSALGVAAIGTAIKIAAEAGDAALAIYQTVESPDDWLGNILGLLVGHVKVPKAARNPEGLGKVAKAFKKLDATTLKTLGKVFNENNDAFDTVLKVCKRRPAP